MNNRPVTLARWLVVFATIGALCAACDSKPTAFKQAFTDLEQGKVVPRATLQALGEDLRKRAKPSLKEIDFPDVSLLEIALAGENFDAARVVIEAGFGVDERGESGRTALIFAAYFLDGKAVQFLLDQGAEPVLSDNKGRTALHRACERNNSSTIKVLATKGSQINRPNGAGLTPLMTYMLKASGMSPDMMTAIEKNGPDGFKRPKLTEAQVADARLLVKAGANPTARDKVRLSALHVAAFCANDDLTLEWITQAKLEGLRSTYEPSLQMWFSVIGSKAARGRLEQRLKEEVR